MQIKYTFIIPKKKMSLDEQPRVNFSGLGKSSIHCWEDGSTAMKKWVEIVEGIYISELDWVFYIWPYINVADLH